ncbi:UNVERIFIED_CONTAM: hypothetical protein K2H54_006092 [Gekko kuhli]
MITDRDLRPALQNGVFGRPTPSDRPRGPIRFCETGNDGEGYDVRGTRLHTLPATEFKDERTGWKGSHSGTPKSISAGYAHLPHGGGGCQAPPAFSERLMAPVTGGECNQPTLEPGWRMPHKAGTGRRNRRHSWLD